MAHGRATALAMAYYAVSLVYNLHNYPDTTLLHRQTLRLLHVAGISGGKTMRVWPGNSYPLGATWDGKGVNFALFSEYATRVELCLFDTLEADKETSRILLPAQTDQVWHAYLPEIL